MSTSNTFIWANLVHLGRNMCSDVPVKSFGKTPPEPFRANIEQAIDPAGDVIRRSAR